MGEIETATQAAAWLLAALARELGLFAAIGLAIGGLDDLAVDLLWITRTLWRRATVYRRHARTTMATLPPPEEPGTLAIFVGAWAESAVIGPMLRTALAGIRHRNYRIYVGTYPNDPETERAVLGIGDARVRMVSGVLPGPTTKAECLNRVWRAMLADERESGRRFKAIVLHDAEDVIHPHELDLYDRMIERFDLVQIPVLPLLASESRWAWMVSATYADEFAESHQKSLVLREAVGAAVPSAGVGCAIRREMIARIADESGGLPFSAESLTEDYELGLRVCAIGGRSAFVILPVAPGHGPVAVRAHFPETVEDAVRQKTRWIIGIALAGWDRLRWEGGLTERWMRVRDRRAPIAALVLAVAYAALLLTILCWIVGVDPGWPPALNSLLMLTSTLLVWRLSMRAFFVTRAYGWREGLCAIPRVFIANLIEIAAARRAVMRYVPGRTPVWDKTRHRFPEGAGD
ncbi:glycosyl transferase family protein [Sphingomonas sp.]|uniref:glycosyl transferase family protein n=1 Tax=Sphingomonas sp. TaxID=28214 RepID=UPI000DB64658|nr:glycosyl transferase family protein [Sphingomonas sp.]PZU06998.1 MAG: glycosyl transferase family protein [Sphingomonas sp.]